eukprot:7713763-Alexandrium_andersonii.AAC.1
MKEVLFETDEAYRKRVWCERWRAQRNQRSLPWTRRARPGWTEPRTSDYLKATHGIEKASKFEGAEYLIMLNGSQGDGP